MPSASGDGHPPVVIPRSRSARILAGQKCLVTGANSGIGRAVALALGRAGADVVVNYVAEPEAAEEVVAGDRAAWASRPSRSGPTSARRTRSSDVRRGASQEFGTLDILVSNAGLQRDAPFDEMTLEQWNTVIGVNLTGQFLCAREAVREFKRRGVRPGGLAAPPARSSA